MEIIDNSKFTSFCDEHGIHLPDKKIGVGRYPSFKPEALRTINVHLLKSDIPDYLLELLKIILKVENEWILSSKFRYIKKLNGLAELANVDAVIFERREQREICDYLSILLNYIRCLTDDLFLLSKSGNIIIRYDHHVISDGLSISLNDINMAGSLLLGLNEMGVELELFYYDG